MIDVAAFERQIANINKADATFLASHEALRELDEDFREEQHNVESMDHQAAVFEAKQLVVDMTNCRAAWQLGRALKIKLEDLESAIADGYSSSLNVQYKAIEERMETF